MKKGQVEILISLARHDERIKAARREAKLTDRLRAIALKIAQAELSRRLEILNGEAGRLREMQATYVPRESFDRFKETAEKESKLAFDGVDARIKRLETGGASSIGKSAGLNAGWGYLIAAVGLAALLVSLWMRGH